MKVYRIKLTKNTSTWAFFDKLKRISYPKNFKICSKWKKDNIQRCKRQEFCRARLPPVTSSVSRKCKINSTFWKKTFSCKIFQKNLKLNYVFGWNKVPETKAYNFPIGIKRFTRSFSIPRFLWLLLKEILEKGKYQIRSTSGPY